MKKFFTTTLLMLVFSGIMFAQTTPAKTATPPAKKMEAVRKDPKSPKDANAKVIPVKKKETVVAAKTATSAGPVKKDGTPDMRFKENKNKPATTTSGPLKKDGTPDKRYKANKKS